MYNMPQKETCKKKISPKQREFIEYYADPTSETFGNGSSSAIKAGYKAHTARITASKLLTKANIQDAITEFRAEKKRKNEITIEWLDEQLIYQYELSDKAFDRTNAKGLLQLIGQRKGAFTEKTINTNTEPTAELTDQDEIEALEKRLERLKRQKCTDSPVLRIKTA